jgi:hypothetical protein
LTGWRTARPCSRAPLARRVLYRFGLRRAPCSGSRARLGVRAGSLPTASRSGPLVPFAPAILGTRAHLRTALYDRRALPRGPSPDPCCARLPRPAPCWGIKAARPVAALSYKGRASVGTAQAAAHAGGTACAPHRGATLPARAPPANTARSFPLDPTAYRCRPCLFPNRRSAGAQLAATVLTVCRRPASCRLFPTHLRPQIDSG